MIKNNKCKLIISSIVILLPMFIGLFFWNELSEQMTTHWGADGNADGWSHKAFAVFGLPLLILVVHWVCVLFTTKDPKNKGQNKKVFAMLLWFCPVISLYANGIVYASSFGKEFNMIFVGPLLIGLMFVVIGNYLPKCKQNYTIGIKIKWALANQENWNATHRFGGKVFVIGGLLLLACIFISETFIPWVLIISLSFIVLVPIIYSYLYYRKQVKAGTAPAKITVPLNKTSKLLSTVVLIGVGILLIVIFTTGKIGLHYDDTAFTIEASFWSDLTVSYDSIDSIEYRETRKAGSRVYGFGGPKLSIGTFQNEEFGNYTLYAYTGSDFCVVLTVDSKTLVISGTDAESTKMIYETLLAKI